MAVGRRWIDGAVAYPQGARNLFVLRVTFPNGVPTAGDQARAKLRRNSISPLSPVLAGPKLGFGIP